jgi:OOP family OmpA-OmpF porin
MRKKFFLLMQIILISAFLISCQAHIPEITHPEFQPLDLNAKWEAGEYKSKVDNLMVILDASRSVGEKAGGRTNFAKSKDFLYRMNQTMPDMELNSALRSFGHWSLKGGGETILNYGPANWSKSDFQAAVDSVLWGAGASPVDQALDNSSEDMASMGKKTAVILIGDGKYHAFDAVAAAKRMKSRYGTNACIHTVLVDSENPDKNQIMQEIANAGECGSYQNAKNLESPQGMANWVEDVFLEKAQVTAPLDSDGDGVYDYLDKCPDTPKGASVDSRGCWVIRGLNFDTAKWDIKPNSYRYLEEVAAILNNNPGLKVEIQGHTDNRGAAEYNQNLSEKRANAVMEYLVGKGITPNRLTAIGYGFSIPATSNDTPAGRAQNRRVELKPIW